MGRVDVERSDRKRNVNFRKMSTRYTGDFDVTFMILSIVVSSVIGSDSMLLLKPDSKWNSWLVERSTVGSTWRHDPQKGFRCVLPKGFYEAVYGTTRVYRRLPVEYKRVLLRFLRPNEL
uniref:Uncharacterized protein n=1 Tax=Vespula pensylvanica TaxID=30213 RepID=A0A834P8N1_VESPE|nr:hypothetical protein H0235_004983 [Vespula pensylvanica]